MKGLDETNDSNNNAYHRWADANGVSRENQTRADAAWLQHMGLTSPALDMTFTDDQIIDLLALRARWIERGATIDV